MGERLGRHTLPPFSFIEEQFEKQCAMYMAMGMSYHDYWYGDIEMTQAVLRATEHKRERENYAMWLQGRYVYDAILRASPVFGFSKRKKPYDYMEEPYKLKTISDEIEEEKYNMKVENSKKLFESLAKAFNESRVTNKNSSEEVMSYRGDSG